MANTLTHDVEATVAQIKKCADAGIDIVRVTVQGMREAKACEFIRKRLDEDGYSTPIVADIHFTPKVALACADWVDKVRVNPGNFSDGRKSFDTISELTKEDIDEAKAAIEEDFAPLVKKLKEKGKALRIGVNHGSMAERILFQYGDSPAGMVASALEFGEICRKYDYHNFCFSMKSSNPQVMVQAYRALAREMYKLGWDYPLHLGVTEAGGGADGRIKSAVGIGALLLDGLGDTIRVSLTEDPEYEAGPTSALRNTAEDAAGKGVEETFEEPSGRREGNFARRKCEFPIDVPLNSDGSVLCTVSAEDLLDIKSDALTKKLGLRVRADGDLQKEFKSADAVVVQGDVTAAMREPLEALLNLPMGVLCRDGEHVPEGATLLHDAASVTSELPQKLGGHALLFTGEESEETVKAALAFGSPRLILFKPTEPVGVTFTGRRFFATLSKLGSAVPVMLWLHYAGKMDEDDVVVKTSADFGSLFVDGLGEGMLWEADSMSAEALLEGSFNLLQASRMRISKTEFISCPSCGRTLFNLQDTTAKIQERTGHLPGVRVAVMGCIVNGPGEMADADFGYVGSGVGKVDLYVNYDVVKRGIKDSLAVEALVDLIKENGKWQEPPELVAELEGELVGA
jgi:(E)-4-hydroxy-3-methylbut-2-enyl-diphosphate synthase